MASTSGPGMLAKIATHDLNKLKCKKCRNLLSVSPVYAVPNGAVCGRCPRPQESTTVRTKTFETLAKYMLFPCTYYNEGCKAVLKFNDVFVHENNCPSRPAAEDNIVKCPLCSQHIKKHNIDSHLNNQHDDDDLPETTFPINVSISQKNNTSLFKLVLRNDDGGPYILSIEADPDDHCDILLYSCTKPCDELRYTVEAVTSDARHLVTTFGAPQRLASCRINSYRADFNSFWIADWLRSIKTILVCNNLYFSVDLIKEVAPREASTTRVRFQQPAIQPTIVSLPHPATGPEVESVTMNAVRPVARPVNDERKSEVVKMRNAFLEVLECWLCKEYLTLPIFNCNVGHSVCSDCKSQLQRCPICQAPYTGSRNFALESLIERYDQYPCKNNTLGCPFVSNQKSKRDHELICSFIRSVSCPLQNMDPLLNRCAWTGALYDVIEHVETVHKIAETCDLLKNIQFLDLLCMPIIQLQLFVYDNIHFVFMTKNEQGKLYFKVTEIGMKLDGDKTKYRFEIDFVDQTKCSRVFIIDDICVPVLNLTDSNSTKNCVVVYEEQVIPFVKDKKVYYKFNIKAI